MISIKVVFLFSLLVNVLASGYHDDQDQDGYLANLLKRVLDLEARHHSKPSTEDDDVAAKGLGLTFISLSKGARNAIDEIKGGDITWMVSKINGTYIVVESTEKGDTYKAFVASLTAHTDECRFGVYKKGDVFLWIPDACSQRMKDLYDDNVSIMRTPLGGGRVDTIEANKVDDLLTDFLQLRFIPGFRPAWLQ